MKDSKRALYILNFRIYNYSNSLKSNKIGVGTPGLWGKMLLGMNKASSPPHLYSWLMAPCQLPLPALSHCCHPGAPTTQTPLHSTPFCLLMSVASALSGMTFSSLWQTLIHLSKPYSNTTCSWAASLELGLG